MRNKSILVFFTVLVVALALMIGVAAAGEDCGNDICISIEKSTNGVDADSPPGPNIPVGHPVLWEYVVKNTGGLTMVEITVVDDQGVVVTCPKDTLVDGESMTCTASGIATAGQYANIGSTTGKRENQTQDTVTATDPSHYFNEEPPTGGEGCTPGYWKNHLEDWAATSYDTSYDFDSTFGVDFFNPDKTLGETIRLGGGGVRKLARHGTAALLSADHPEVSYPLTVAEVIAFVQSGDADPLVSANELGCDIP